MLSSERELTERVGWNFLERNIYSVPMIHDCPPPPSHNNIIIETLSIFLYKNGTSKICLK